MTGIQQYRDTLPCTRNRGIDRSAFRITPPSLNVVNHQMVVHCVQNHLWDLGAGCVVEENKAIIKVEGGKVSANRLYSKPFQSVICRKTGFHHNSSTLRYLGATQSISQEYRMYTNTGKSLYMLDLYK